MYKETEIRSSRDLLWYRSIVIKEVDNLSSMSRGEKEDHVANQLDKVKAFKVNNVHLYSATISCCLNYFTIISILFRVSNSAQKFPKLQKSTQR